MLDPRIERLIRERGFERLTEPQRLALPHILSGRDTLILAPTGSGKTEAAFIPILDMLVRRPGEPIQVVYITPLKSLNRDIIDRLIWWASRLDLSISVRHSDTPQRERRRQGLNPPDILVTTPETFTYLLNTKTFSQYLARARWVVVDELHELIPSKRGVQLSIALERLRRLRRGDLQVIGLSATIGNPEEALKYITGLDGEGVYVRADLEKRIEVGISYPQPTRRDVELAERLYTYPAVAARVRHIVERIREVGKTLIFTNTRPMAEILGNRLLLYSQEMKTAVHHSSIGTEYRIRVEELYKKGVLEAIVATSSLELGIDIGDIKYVIQYGSPRQVSKLIQRIGRAGHWIEEVSRGEIVAIDPYDALESFSIRSHAYARRVEDIYFLDKPLDVLIHEVAGILISEKRLSIAMLHQLLRNIVYYRDLSIEELVETLEYIGEATRIWRVDGDALRIGDHKRLYRYYFENLSMIPDIKQYPVVDDTSGKIVGVLDDEFLAVAGEEGTKIILAGRPWRILQIYGEKVFVKPEDDPIGAVPDWIGEEIPVPYEIAQEVGRLLRLFREVYREAGYREAVNRISREYSIDPETVDYALEIFAEELGSGYEIPSDDVITIESDGPRLVVNILGGTNTNRTLETYLVHELEERYSIQARHSSDQYRIILESPFIEPEHVIDILSNPGDIERALREAAPRTSIYRWRFLNVAKRMGLITREAEITQKLIDTMIEHNRGRPPYLEALRESLKRDHDLTGARKILGGIASGGIRLVAYPGHLSRMTTEYVRYSDIPMEGPRKPRYQLLEVIATRARALATYVTMACLTCGEYIVETRVLELPERPHCPVCGSDEVGITRERPSETMRELEMARMGRTGGRILRELRRTSRLYRRYGKPGIYAYVVGGLTLSDIEEALRKEPRIGDRLTQILLELRRRRLAERLRPSRRG